MSEKVVRRSADITPKEALNGLRAKFAGYRIVSFGVVANGQAYEAKLVKGEFPPGKGEEAPESDGPPVDPDQDGDDDSSPEGDSDSDSGGPPAPPKGKGKEKGNGVEHEMLGILKEIAMAVGVPPAGAGGPGDVPPPGADPGMAGGDMPPPAAPDPLPPPVKPHGAPGGGGLGMPFAKVAAERRSFVVWREPEADGSLPTVKQAVTEITAQLPTSHRVAKIMKRMAKIEGGKPTQVYVVAVNAK